MAVTWTACAEGTFAEGLFFGNFRPLFKINEKRAQGRLHRYRAAENVFEATSSRRVGDRNRLRVGNQHCTERYMCLGNCLTSDGRITGLPSSSTRRECRPTGYTAFRALVREKSGARLIPLLGPQERQSRQCSGRSHDRHPGELLNPRTSTARRRLGIPSTRRARAYSPSRV